MTVSTSLNLGVTFHSFTEEYCAGKWSFEDMMELSTHLGGGVEIVGPAHQRGFPNLTIEFERMFKSAVERFGLTPTAYGSYADPFMLPDRNLNDDELIDYTSKQLRTAATLGFPVMRVQNYIYGVAERMLPLAERLGVKMGYELHAPMTFESAITQRLIEQIRRVDSPCLGLVPDFGIFAHSIPRFRLEGAREAGVGQAIIDRADELWHQSTDVGEALAELKDMGLLERQVGAIEMFFGTLGKSDPAYMIEVMPDIVHIHGKYFSIEEGDEPNVQYREIVSALLKGRYSGWISSEYEGPGGICSFNVVRQHHEMIRRHERDLMMEITD